jgi:hypothetical protein
MLLVDEQAILYQKVFENKTYFTLILPLKMSVEVNFVEVISTVKAKEYFTLINKF